MRKPAYLREGIDSESLNVSLISDAVDPHKSSLMNDKAAKTVDDLPAQAQNALSGSLPTAMVADAEDNHLDEHDDSDGDAHDHEDDHDGGSDQPDLPHSTHILEDDHDHDDGHGYPIDDFVEVSATEGGSSGADSDLYAAGILGDMADYLTLGYWQASGSSAGERFHNVTDTGLDPNDGRRD